MTYANCGFDPFVISMVAHGELSGILTISLKQASQIMEKRNEVGMKIIGACIYPALIVLATLCMSLFLVMYIFPKIVPLFSSMNITLPMLTRVVLRIYEILRQYGILIFGILLTGSASIYYLYRKNKKISSAIQIFFLTLPIIGNIIKKYFISIYCRNIGILLDCGQSLPIIIEWNRDSSSLEPYARAWNICRLEVVKGVPLSECLRSFQTLFPPIVSDMISIGERTGSLASMFHHVSCIYEQEIDDFVKALSTTIEPVLMIFMGGLVGSIALSIILPIYDITNHLTK